MVNDRSRARRRELCTLEGAIESRTGQGKGKGQGIDTEGRGNRQELSMAARNTNEGSRHVEV